jgi:glycosyltransferase involved in cell wall biosynthesis
MAAVPDSAVFVIDPATIEKYEPLIGKNIVVIIPAFNEARFIGSVVLGLEKFVSTIIVVDDGSSDNTAEIARAAGAKVFRHKVNQGKGEALNTGFAEAITLKPDVVVMIDADGQHKPEELPDLVMPILNGEADLVIGSRYLKDFSNVPKRRVYGHRFFNLLTKNTSGTSVSDSQSGYRAFSRKALEVISFSSAGFSVESEMQFIAKEKGLKVKDVPIKIEYLDAPKRSIWKQGLDVLSGILRLVSQYRPLMYFGVPGLISIGIGFAFGIRVVNIFRQTTLLAAGTAMLSIMMVILGAVGLSTGVILHSIRGLLQDFQGSKHPFR